MASIVPQRREAVTNVITEGLRKLGPCPSDLVAEQWIDIPCSGGYVNRTKLVYPVSSSTSSSSSGSTPKSCPLIVYFFGGGFAFGGPEQLLGPARAFATHFGCVVALPDYRLCPEHRFPEPMRSAYDACSWLSDAEENLNRGGALKDAGVKVDLGLGFVVGGISAGATNAAVICGLASAAAAAAAAAEEEEDDDDDDVEKYLVEGQQKKFKTLPTGAFIGVPLTVAEEMVPDKWKPLLKSRAEGEQLTEGFTMDQLRMVMSLLGPDVKSPWFSPLNLSGGEGPPRGHAKKVFTYACERDPLRDDAEIYEAWLKEGKEGENVEVKRKVVPGELHGGWTTMDMEANHKREFKEVTMDGMGWVLGREWDRGKELPY